MALKNTFHMGRARSEPPEAAKTCPPELNNMAGLGRPGDLAAALPNAR